MIPGFDCKVCHGFSRTKCWFCGNKAKLKKNMTPRELSDFESWEEEISYLRSTYVKMIKNRSKTTNCKTLDDKIKKYIGDFVRMIDLNDAHDNEQRKYEKISFTYKNECVFIQKRLYQNRAICLQVINMTGELIATLTVNIPEVKLEPGEFFVKTWSENKGIVYTARRTGLFVDTGKRQNVGYAEAEIWKIKE